MSEVKPISPKDLAVVFSGPACWSDKVYLTPNGPIARITFCEISADAPVFRTAVVMQLPDVMALRDLLTRMIDGAKPEGTVIQ